MRHRVLLSVKAVLFVAVIVLGSSPALSAPALLEVTGTLEAVNQGERGEVVTLKVYDKLASGPLSSDCRFQDERGAVVEKSVFLERYMKRVVTLELEEDSGAVVLFRVGS